MPSKAPHKVAVAACAFELIPAEGAIRLLPDGEFRAKDGRPVECAAWRLTADLAARIIAQVSARKRPTAIDYEHALLKSKQTGNEAPAAGWWGNGLEYRPGDGLYAVGVQWTERAAQMIAAREYRFISPVFAYSDQSGDVLAVLNFSLTNDPALEQLDELSLAAASAHFDLSPEPNPTEQPMALPVAVRDLLGLASDNPADAEITAACAALSAKIGEVDSLTAQLAALSAQAPDPAKFVPVTVFNELTGKLAALASRLDGQDKDALIKRGLESGQIFAGDHEAWARTLDVAALSAYLDKAPKLAALAGTQTGGKAGPLAGDHLPLEERANAEWTACADLRAEFGGDKEAYIAYCKADRAGLAHIFKGGKE